jgi:hypothetical protein
MGLTTRPMRRVGMLAILGASMAIGRGEATGRQGDAGPSRATDPLVALNDRFHDAYRRARLERLAQAGPVVMVGFNNLALLRHGNRAEVPFPPPIYQKLKEVAHVPLMTFVLLSGTEGRPLDAVKRAEVGHIRELVAAASEGIDRAGFPASSLDRQREILAMTADYLAVVLKDGRAPSEALADYARRTSPLMLANADDAARAHLTALNDQMEAWRRELTPEEWRSMYVVVMSAHMARDREIAMQYFTRLLGEPTEGHRLIFAEGLFEEPRALDLLGTHLLDGAASVAFFGDEMRLHRDLLSDGATKALQSMTIRP